MLIVLRLPFVTPLNAVVRWLAGTQDRAMKKRIVEVADEVGATSVICERFEAPDRGKGDSAQPVPGIRQSGAARSRRRVHGRRTGWVVVIQSSGRLARRRRRL